MIWGVFRNSPYFWVQHPYRDILDTYHLNSLHFFFNPPPAEPKAVEGSPEAWRLSRENIRFFFLAKKMVIPVAGLAGSEHSINIMHFKNNCLYLYKCIYISLHAPANASRNVKQVDLWGHHTFTHVQCVFYHVL